MKYLEINLNIFYVLNLFVKVLIYKFNLNEYLFSIFCLVENFRLRESKI